MSEWPFSARPCLSWIHERHVRNVGVSKDSKLLALSPSRPLVRCSCAVTSELTEEESCLSAVTSANEKSLESGPRSGRGCPSLPGAEVWLTKGARFNLSKLPDLSKHLQVIHAWSHSTFRQEKVKMTPKGAPSRAHTVKRGPRLHL